jgi:hypothetical protein
VLLWGGVFRLCQGFGGRRSFGEGVRPPPQGGPEKARPACEHFPVSTRESACVVVHVVTAATMPLFCLDQPQAPPLRAATCGRPPTRPVDDFQKNLAFYDCDVGFGLTALGSGRVMPIATRADRCTPRPLRGSAPAMWML